MRRKQRQANFNKSAYLYGQMNVWRCMLKVGSTGILIAFFSGLFTFVDQLLLVNLMPQTTLYDFNHLFLLPGVFHDLIGRFSLNAKDSRNLIRAIAYANGWGFYNSDSVVRAGVSLTVGVSDFMFVVPAIFSIGLSVQYGIALGQGNLAQAKKVWQNAFYGTIFVTLIGMVITFFLTAFVIPAESVKNTVAFNTFIVANYGTVQNNVIYFANGQYYAGIIGATHITGYLALTSSVAETQSYHVITQLNPTAIYTFANSTLINTWNAYFALSRHYSIIWAQNFCYIYGAGLLAFSFASLIITLLRNEGVIYFVTCISIFVVGLNILFDYLLIQDAEIGMAGAATASVLGWVLQFIFCYFYLKWKRGLVLHATFADLKWNKALALNFRSMLNLTWYGFSVFVGSIGVAIFDILLTRQVSAVAVDIMGDVGSEYYLSVLGAVLPIVNLFVMSLIGLIQYASPVFSYNFGQKQYTRFIHAFYSASVYALIFSLVVYGVVCFIPAVTDGILSWFQVTSTSPNNELLSSVKLLRIWMVQLIGFALAMGGMLSWLTSGRAGWNTFFNIVRPLAFILLLYIFSAVAINDRYTLNSGLDVSALNTPYENKAMWFFMWNAPVSNLLGSAVWCVWTMIYLYTRLDKPVKVKVRKQKRVTV